jgi:hypothetical protein
MRGMQAGRVKVANNSLGHGYFQLAGLPLSFPPNLLDPSPPTSIPRGHEVLSIKPEVGLMVVHAQGSQCLLHEGRPVGRGGDKWVLRSDVMVAPREEELEAAA